VLGTYGLAAWVCLSLSRVTVLGKAEVHSAGLVEDSIVTGALRCERRQTGEVRFCYLGPGSRTPRRTSCQPDAALARVHAETAGGASAPGDRRWLEAMTAARLVPCFDSVRFGQPGYARLAGDAAPELTHGAHDEGELGAYHDLWQPQRVAGARAQLRQFVPAGVDIDIRFAT
jgi:hypothetical protein